MLQQSAVHIRYVTPHHKTITPLYDSKPSITNTAHFTAKLYICITLQDHTKLLICHTLHGLTIPMQHITIPSITPHYSALQIRHCRLLHWTIASRDTTIHRLDGTILYIAFTIHDQTGRYYYTTRRYSTLRHFAIQVQNKSSQYSTYTTHY